MTNAQTLLPALKIDLGITKQNFDERLIAYIQFAQGEIQREGITLQANSNDDQLTIMYASWLWRKRTTGEGMPRMIRYALNNRLFAEKVAT